MVHRPCACMIRRLSGGSSLCGGFCHEAVSTGPDATKGPRRAPSSPFGATDQGTCTPPTPATPTQALGLEPTLIVPLSPLEGAGPMGPLLSPETYPPLELPPTSR